MQRRMPSPALAKRAAPLDGHDSDDERNVKRQRAEPPFEAYRQQVYAKLEQVVRNNEAAAIVAQRLRHVAFQHPGAHDVVLRVSELDRKQDWPKNVIEATMRLHFASTFQEQESALLRLADAIAVALCINTEVHIDGIHTTPRVEQPGFERLVRLSFYEDEPTFHVWVKAFCADMVCCYYAKRDFPHLLE